jgi:hypothetical protein
MTKSLKDFWRRIGDFLRNGDVGSSLSAGPAEYGSGQRAFFAHFSIWPDRAIPDC